MKHLLAVNIGDTPLAPGWSLASRYSSFGDIINLILRNSFTVISILLLVLLVFGGLQYIMNAGSGDSKKLAQAQAAITDAIIGFIVVFLAYFIIQIIEVFTGIKILNSGL